MARWGMVIDLRKCVGCKTCSYVCRDTNNVLGPAWRQVVDCEIGEYVKSRRRFVSMGCMHCSKAPCVEVCPTSASYRRPDGIVDIDYELCVGCGYCVVACPYNARAIVWEDSVMEHEDRVGVCAKCNFCLPRIEAGLEQGLRPGVDPEATPACVVSCIANAMCFGDLDDQDSQVSRLIRTNKIIRLQEELGTEPSVYYIV